MSVRHFLERIGLIEAEDEIMAEHEAVRMVAEEVNREARREIHDSRARRAVLQLRLEQIQRRARAH